MKILQLDSGLFAGQSVSRDLTQKIVAQLQQQHPQAEVIYRDLIAQPVAHLDAEILTASATAEAERSPRQQQELALTETLLEEIFAADVLVIGAPLYNFSLPTQLKAWIDRITQAGRTFQYTAEGPEGLLKGKKAFIASAQGGLYSEGAAAAMEHQESYLRVLLAFIGIEEVHLIRAAGLNMPEHREAGLRQAAEAIAAL
ncbi:FMN-dependent NADH-azoreductase [Marinospirillum sp.]|uniref:FMN-dependent NADH-azoreductase n=1 Tax=Marinospirillum sp. TaxID=2183934 RepID=UPI003A860796